MSQNTIGAAVAPLEQKRKIQADVIPTGASNKSDQQQLEKLLVLTQRLKAVLDQANKIGMVNSEDLVEIDSLKQEVFSALPPEVAGGLETFDSNAKVEVSEATKAMEEAASRVRTQVRSVGNDAMEIDDLGMTEVQTIATETKGALLKSASQVLTFINNDSVFASSFSYDLMSLPVAVLSLSVIQVSNQISSAQANLAEKKMEAMTKLIEKMQAMTTLMLSLTAAENKEFSRQTTEKAQSGQASDGINTIDWDQLSRFHGQGVTHNYYDVSALLGYLTFGYDRHHFENNPLVKFLVDNGFATLSGTGTNVTTKLTPTDKLKNGRLDFDKLTPEQKNAFEKAWDFNQGSKSDSYDGKDTSQYYSDKLKHEVVTDMPDFYIYSNIPGSKPQKVDLSKGYYANSVIFSADEIPADLLALLPKEAGLGNSADGKITHYALNKAAITNLFTAMTHQYQTAMGETPDDLNDKLASGITGTVKDHDNIAQILAQKIKYVQDKQTALAKIPENAKEGQDTLLNMFNNLLRSISA